MNNSEKAEEKKRKFVEDETGLSLSLSLQPFNSHRQSLPELTPFQRMFSQPLTPPTQPPPQPMQTLFMPQVPPPVPPPPQPLPPPRAVRRRRQGPGEGKSDTIPIPFIWATNQRATVHNLKYLLQIEVFKITGEVQCKRCSKKFEMAFDLKEKFAEIWYCFANNKSNMHDRAPSVWMNPVLPKCEHCNQENSVKPVIAEKKKAINWLFLLLGQMLGYCTLEQLKYFCKHSKIHRTGAKDRILYSTYLGLCKQLDPQDRMFDQH